MTPVPVFGAGVTARVSGGLSDSNKSNGTSPGGALNAAAYSASAPAGTRPCSAASRNPPSVARLRSSRRSRVSGSTGDPPATVRVSASWIPSASRPHGRRPHGRPVTTPLAVGSGVGHRPSTWRQDPGFVGFRSAGHAPRREQHPLAISARTSARPGVDDDAECVEPSSPSPTTNLVSDQFTGLHGITVPGEVARQPGAARGRARTADRSCSPRDAGLPGGRTCAKRAG